MILNSNGWARNEVWQIKLKLIWPVIITEIPYSTLQCFYLRCSSLTHIPRGENHLLSYVCKDGKGRIQEFGLNHADYYMLALPSLPTTFPCDHEPQSATASSRTSIDDGWFNCPLPHSYPSPKIFTCLNNSSTSMSTFWGEFLMQWGYDHDSRDACSHSRLHRKPKQCKTGGGGDGCQKTFAALTSCARSLF